MSIDDWADLFTQTVTITQFASTDKYGNPAYVSPINYSARVVQKATLVLDSNPNSSTVGQQVVASGTVWMQTATAIDYNDQLTLPSGQSPEILLVEQYPDQGGDHHIKIMYRGNHG